MKKLLLILLAFIALASCDSKPDSSCGQAFIGGEIINPINDHLILYDDTSLIDTLYLDKDNRFSYKLETLSPGLHSFTHGGENQIIILEPNDSVMIRLNTLDFDESLVFTGRGAKKNNYLINLFVKLESEDNIMYEFSKLEPHEFQLKLDSIKQEKVNDLNHFIEKYKGSDLFKKIANAGINYSYYSSQELYPLRHFGMDNPINLDSLPNGYYNFRKNIDYNDGDLKDFYPYYILMFNHFNNLASEKYFAETNDSNNIS